MATISYHDRAVTFQNAKIEAASTEAGKAYAGAKGALKAAFATYRVEKGGVDAAQMAKDLFKTESTQQKAAKKFAEWLKKPAEEQKESSEDAAGALKEAAVRFEAQFEASKLSEKVMDARAAKKAFKAATCELLSAGKDATQLQAELAGLHAKTVGKVAYWAKKFA